MTLNENTLTINIGDTVTFHAQTNDGENVYLTGEVKGTVSGDELTIRVNVNEFLVCTIAARALDSVNGVFLSFKKFRDNLNFSVGV